jgi:hypothetical protein
MYRDRKYLKGRVVGISRKPATILAASLPKHLSALHKLLIIFPLND